MRIDEEDQLLESNGAIMGRANQRGQSQHIRASAFDGKGSSAPMSAIPLRNNLIPALNGDDGSVGGDGRSNPNQ